MEVCFRLTFFCDFPWLLIFLLFFFFFFFFDFLFPCFLGDASCALCVTIDCDKAHAVVSSLRKKKKKRRKKKKKFLTTCFCAVQHQDGFEDCARRHLRCRMQHSQSCFCAVCSSSCLFARARCRVQGRVQGKDKRRKKNMKKENVFFPKQGRFAKRFGEGNERSRRNSRDCGASCLFLKSNDEWLF
jgi:hypothetical protein